MAMLNNQMVYIELLLCNAIATAPICCMADLDIFSQFSHIHPQVSLKSHIHILVDVPAPMEQLQMPPRTRTMAMKTPFSPSEFRWGILQCSSDCRAVTRLQRVPDLDPVAFFLPVSMASSPPNMAQNMVQILKFP